MSEPAAESTADAVVSEANASNSVKCGDAPASGNAAASKTTAVSGDAAASTANAHSGTQPAVAAVSEHATNSASNAANGNGTTRSAFHAAPDGDSPHSASPAPAAYCPQCELRAMQAVLTPERIRAQVAAMGAQPGVTAPPAEYERRLAVCAACPRLQGGVLCAECGSYVAYRARLQNARCPFPASDKWRAASR